METVQILNGVVRIDSLKELHLSKFKPWERRMSGFCNLTKSPEAGEHRPCSKNSTEASGAAAMKEEVSHRR